MDQCTSEMRIMPLPSGHEVLIEIRRQRAREMLAKSVEAKVADWIDEHAGPFDDQQCRQAGVDDLRRGVIQAYLQEVESELNRNSGKTTLTDLGRRLNIVDGVDEFAIPRNVGVLFFQDEPRRFLPRARIDVVIFPDGPGGDVLNGDGPQARQCPKRRAG